MAKSQTKQATQMAQQGSQQGQIQTTKYGQELRDQLYPNIGQTQNTRNQVTEAYTGMGGPTGAYDPNEYAGIQSQITQNYNKAGESAYTPEQLAQVRANEAEQVGTGGFDPGQTANIEQGYGDLIKTGGISPETAQAMQRQAAGASQSVYSTLGANLARQQKAQGFGGGGGETAQMARQASQQAATATTGVNAQIGQLRQQGTQAGLSGLGGFETSLAGGRRAAVGQQATTESDVAQKEQVGRQQQQQDTQARQDLATNAASQKVQAAGGLLNLYNTNQAYVTNLINGIMDTIKTGGQLSAENAQIMQELSKNPGLYQNIMQGIQTIGGAAGGVLTGIGSMG